MFTSEHLGKMKDAIQLFNEKKYWECHEALEDLWMEDRHDPVRNVYWAIIQVAAACIHYREKNLIGAQGMINKAKEKFKKCHEHRLINDLMLQNLDWKQLEEIVLEIPNGNFSSLSDFEEIYKFKFLHYSKV